MKKEHALITLSEGKGECICNPEILLGSTFGLWDSEYRVAPKGTLLDLNAAWELFYDRRTFLKDIKFGVQEHYKTETVDGILYHAGDVTYTLLDDKGQKTGATFTMKGNWNLANQMDWQNGSLVLYYDKVRALTDEDLASGYDIHYVVDEQGNNIIEDGKSLIYSYAAIPLFDIFDADEMHKIFPWFADNQHTVRLRQNLDNSNNTTEGHLGDFAITKESEVFIAKQRYDENENNILISLQSFIQQVFDILGITPDYTNVPEIIDEEGTSTHQRITGTNIQSILNKESFANAIQSIVQNSGDLSNLNTTQKQDLVIAVNEVLSKLIQFEQSSGVVNEQINSAIQQINTTISQHTNNQQNPHGVNANQLSVTVNDPNNSGNSNFDQTYNVQLNVLTALQELFNRLNTAEDKATQLASIFGSSADLLALDELDNTLGNNNPTVIGTLISLYNSIQTQPISDVSDLVTEYFIL